MVAAMATAGLGGLEAARAAPRRARRTADPAARAGGGRRGCLGRGRRLAARAASGGGEQLTDAGVDGKDAAGEVAPKKKKETQPRRRQRAFYEDAASGMQQLAIPSETNRTDMYSFDVSTTKTGLHRSPVTGGVASASHTHTLPSPAVAVRNLMEQARYGQLCTLMSRSNHRRAGYPFGSVVDFVTDDAGMPIFALSPLAIHTRNLNEDSRATIVVQMPGWHGMANARVTLFGDIYPVDPERTSVARECFRQKHDSPKHHTLYANSGSSFQYFHMHTLHDIYFVGGFGTVTWINCEDYYNATPDQITRDCEATLRMLNDTFRAPMIELFGSSLEHPLDSDHKDQDPDSVNIITIDQRGVDVRLRYGSEYSIRRLCFDRLVDTPEQAAAAMQRITTSSTGEGIGLGGIDVE